MAPSVSAVSAAFVALLVLVSGMAEAAGASFEYFILARQWPGTYCGPNAPPCARQPKRDIFTIHGLWPDNTRGPDPSKCDNSDPFNIELIEDLKPQLLVNWPSYGKSNEWFWDHEWTKHGTCAKSVLQDEAAYFGKTLELNEKYDLLDALEAAGITVGTTEEISTSQVAKALKDAFLARPVINCGADGVKEIFTCFDKSFKPIDCPGGAAFAISGASEEVPVRASCGRTTEFPSVFGNKKIDRISRGIDLKKTT